MVETIPFHSLVTPRGKTIKEENQAIQHNISIGTLVEVKWDRWFSGGACWKVHARLWVVAHRRDCDGTPLYSVSSWNASKFAMRGRAYHGFGEESLIPVEITDEVRLGEGALEWEDRYD